VGAAAEGAAGPNPVANPPRVVLTEPAQVLLARVLAGVIHDDTPCSAALALLQLAAGMVSGGQGGGGA
jgi:hypothetical protein